MIKGIEVIEQKVAKDERGMLVKILMSSQISNKNFGEIYYIDAKGDSIRGNHYHKKTTEWFSVLEGQAILKLRDENTNEEDSIILDSQNHKIVKVPPNISHAFIVNKAVKIIVYSDKEYDIKETDTFKVNLE